MIIERIAKRRGHLTALICDGRELARLDTDVVFDENIRAGADCSEERLSELLAMSNALRAKRRAYSMLSFRDHSKSELMTKLRRGTDEQSAQAAVEKMEELRLLDDDEYARNYAARLSKYKHYGTHRIRQELLAKGISRELADEAISLLDINHEEQITQLLLGKFARQMSDEKGRKRTFSALQRYGYGFSEIRAAMRAFDEEYQDDDCGGDIDYDETADDCDYFDEGD
ncbi:MAG: recombination regulator RecX [Oscillospiraceae bacterium]|jgi:regulatory protein|nr:recombination regulator RecX [Oscillospiraceae bacterium]